ncbi:exodeoxyribonuclease V subunit gamma [Accumulibacter sp.]|uniref:exodeoxyribonuclease V subunit gamma n=1 Tax=Accumulibacter sp. TaxID=2053492 RepID=UPI0025D3D8FA|nr:exodeoxyribonuclease V subunit gamma [Accumulibacter sp.]MDS4050471.1 exodeoxyribonuclease V subunit gamma [Accumulibacter sp.]
MPTAQPEPGLILVHGNRAESLRDLVIAWMKRQPLAPLDNEVVLVHSNGIAQWLRIALAADPRGADGGCGIAAAIETLLPSRFVWRAYRALLGAGAVPETSPFDEARLVWRLLRLLPELAHQPEFAALRAFLSDDDDSRKRFQLAGRLADLFDQYQVYRADWLTAWAAGRDVLIDGQHRERALDPGQRWQAALWRALLADVRVNHGPRDEAASRGRAAVHEAFVRCARSWPSGERPAGLPRRLIVFGISSLPGQSLEVLAEIARWTQVLVCVPNPCRHYWADIVAARDLLRPRDVRQRRRVPREIPEEQLYLHANPLLAAWGKQGRDFIGLLDEHDSDLAQARLLPQLAAFGQRVDLFEPSGGRTLLEQLQDDILELRPVHESRECWPPVDVERDVSIRFHVAHSAQREVEILHDQLLAAFNDDPGLAPHEVIVMVPDIDRYAPHVQAVFGLVDTGDPRHLPFALADRGRRQVEPLLNALQKLLDLPQSRLAVSDLLDLLEVPALQRRFAIGANDLPRLRRWIRAANVRWGLHDEQRAGLGLPAVGDEPARNTWLFGLRRMLLGYAVGGSGGAWQQIEPCDGIGGLEAALLGTLVQLVERLDDNWRALREPATVDVWCVRLRRLIADFFVAAEGRDALTLLQLDEALQAWQAASAEAAVEEPLPLSVVAENWLSSLDDGGMTQSFLGGAITFATLMPMRAIPFRYVCLLGMNDGDYPRSRTAMDFDLMADEHRPGDRSRREDDRYLFLEALLSARERLHVSWIGRSVHDNRPRPPSVLVGQLRDHLAAGWTRSGYPGPGSGEALLAGLTTEHRLQAFSADYFPRDPENSVLFSYAHEWRPQAAGSAHRRAARYEPLPVALRDEPLSLDDLGRFLSRPVRAFFEQRLGVSFVGEDPASEDVEPFGLDGLTRWTLQDELIRAQAGALAAGLDPAEAREARLGAFRRRGDLPAGAFADVLASELVAPIDDLFARYGAALARWPQEVDRAGEFRFAADLAGQRVEVVDRLGGLLGDAAGRLGRVELESRDLIRKRRYRGEVVVAHWVRHLALQLCAGRVTTMLVGKVGDVELPPLPAEQAAAQLTDLLHAWQQGMCRPLPLAVKTGFAWLREGREAARSAYEGGFGVAGEVGNDPALALVYPDFAALVAGGEFVEFVDRLLRPIHSAVHGGTEAGGVPVDAGKDP